MIFVTSSAVMVYLLVLPRSICGRMSGCLLPVSSDREDGFSVEDLIEKEEFDYPVNYGYTSFREFR